MVGIRGAEIAMVPGQGAAQRTAVGFGRGVRHHACGLRLGGVVGRIGLALARRAGEAGYRKVAALAPEAVGMDREFAVADFNQACEGAFIGGATDSTFGGALDAMDGRLGNPVGQHVDHTAHRAAAVEKGGRSTHHLDALDCHRVGRHRMVERQAGGVQCADRALQNANAVTVLAANDRPAGAGAEIGGTDARQIADGLAQASAAAQLQVRRLDGRDRDCKFEQAAAERIAGDHHFSGRAG